jgi:SAM-dependent methyltransferase
MRTVSALEARRIYDRIGKAQDGQAFYEDRATDVLITHLDLASARSVFEFGPGTGRFAARLLATQLPPAASYRGVDVSPVMVRLASERLVRFGPRASVRLSEGGPPTDEPGGGYDRFVSNFVLDLLSPEAIEGVIREAHRMLVPGGLLGLASLASGFTTASRIVSWMWLRVHALRPSLVGGCRPLELREVLPGEAWRIRHRARVAPLGLPLEAVVAERLPIRP